MQRASPIKFRLIPPPPPRILAIWTLGLIAALAGCATQPSRPETDVAASPQLADVLSRAIRIKTVNPPGDERPLAEYFASILADAGLESQVVETPAGQSQLGRASSWGVVRGSGQRRPIVLLSHLDVVPADPENWDDDPFGGAQRDGYVIGRGALDAKGTGVVHLFAMLELAKRAAPLDRDVIFLATPDEETGGVDGAGYIATQRPDLLGGAEFLLTEGGGILDRGAPKPNLWRIGVVEKSPCWLRLVSQGRAGHSSAPPRDAAVPALVAALGRVLQMDFPIRVVPEVQAMYAALAPLAPPEDAAGYADLERQLEADPAFRSRFMTLRFQAALVSDTLTPTVLQGSSRTNVLPAQAVAHLDARLLPGENCALFSHQVAAAIGNSAIRVETLLSFPTRASPTDTPLYAAIEAVARRATPPAHTVPSVTVGFTDAHYFRDIGITSYGFTPRAARGEDSAGVHGDNERASVASLTEAVARLLEILDELEARD